MIQYCTPSSFRVKPLLVSYDFDNTLKNQYTFEPVYPVLQQMINDKKKGYRLIICTSRFKQYTDEIRGFLKRNGLGDVPIHATNHKPKSPVLQKYANSGYQVIHYDDQDGVLDEIVTNIPDSICYKVLYDGVKPESKYTDVVVRYDR